MIRQGHRYRYRARDVLALESEGVPGQPVSVAVIDASRPWALGEPMQAAPAELLALPMRYFHGQTPAGGGAAVATPPPVHEQQNGTCFESPAP